MALLDYQECSSVGDIVMIENNSVLAVVTKKESVARSINEPPTAILHIYPFVGILNRLKLRLQGRLVFEGKRVDDPSFINPIHMVRVKEYQM